MVGSPGWWDQVKAVSKNLKLIRIFTFLYIFDTVISNISNKMKYLALSDQFPFQIQINMDLKGIRCQPTCVLPRSNLIHKSPKVLNGSGGSKGGAPGAPPPAPTAQNFRNFMRYFRNFRNFWKS